MAAKVLCIITLLFLMMNVSCRECVSGMFGYDIKVRIVDENGTPLKKIRVIVERDDEYLLFSDISCDCSCAAYCRSTDKDGTAVVSATFGRSWSYCEPNTVTESSPVPIKVYPWVEYPEDVWTMYEIRVTDEMIVGEEPRWLYMDIGTITINTTTDENEEGDAGM